MELKSVEECAKEKTCRDLDFFRYAAEDRDGTMIDGIFRNGICIDPEDHERISDVLENDTWVSAIALKILKQNFLSSLKVIT